MNKVPEIVVDEECSKLLNKSLLPEEIKYLIKLLRIDMITDEARMKLIYYLDNQDKEIERLNNIIDELENFIKTYAIPEFTLNEPHRLFMETKIILDKLKELKEGK